MTTTYTNRSVTYTLFFEAGDISPVALEFPLGIAGIAVALEDLDSAVTALVGDLHPNEPITIVTRTFGATGTDGEPWLEPI